LYFLLKILLLLVAKLKSLLSHIIKKIVKQIPYLFNKIVSKKKREYGREYNGKKENVNAMISIGPQWIEREHEYYGEYRTTAGGTYIIMRII